MKKRFLSLTLALIMALSLLPMSVFAANSKPVTVGNITFSDTIVTDKYESYADYLEWLIAEGAKNVEITPADETYYRLGMASVKPEEGADYQFSSFSTYIIPDDATITFNSTKEQEAIVYFLTLKELPEYASRSDSYYEMAWAGDFTYTEKNWSLTRAEILDPKTWQGHGVPDFDLIAIRVDNEADIYVMFSSDSPLAATTTPPSTPAPSFTDVPAGAYYADPVAWAVKEGITNGTSTTKFSPDEKCTQVQIITFLWRAAGEPTSSTKVPITVASYYQDAVNWAYASHLIFDDFKPDTPCDRLQAVLYIWMALKWPKATKTTVAFTDLPNNESLLEAVSWAVEKGVTNGTSTTTFSPGDTCTRGQIVTFLYRAYVEAK